MMIKNRRELRSTSVDGSLRSIPTQYLSTSSLVSEVVKFDMSEWNISNDGYIKRVGSLYE